MTTTPRRVAGRTKATGASARELRILNQIAEALNSSGEVREALERTLSLVADLLGLRTGWVWLLDDQTDQFYNAASLNLPPYLQEPVRMSNTWCLCTDAFRSGETRAKNIDVLECTRLSGASRQGAGSKTRGLRYHATIPLYFQGKPLGIMNVTGPSWRKLTAQELRLLSTIAYQVGIAIERAKLAGDGARLARAEERTRLAREIHDTLAQGLTAIALQIEGAMHLLETRPEGARARLECALSVSRESLEEARRSVLNLRAAPLAGRPLVDALGALGRAFTSETGVPVHVTADERAGASLPLGLEAELFRVAQEALANAKKHSGAREVRLALKSTARSARLEVRDDGRGFDPKRTREGAHGILGMRERARLVGGTLRVRTGVGKGTSVVVTVPRGARG